LASVSYIAGDNTTRQRDLVSGDGSLANPDVVRSEDPTMQGIGTVISGNVVDIETIVAAISSRLPTALVTGRLPVDSLYQAITGATPNLTVTGGVALTASTGVFIATANFTRFRVQINNIGANALTGLEISTRAHASADMQVHLNASAHYTAPPANSILRLSGDTLGAATDPTLLAGSTGKVILAFDFTNFFAETLRIRASATTTTTLQFFWGGM
jgi:hypothetical protein